MLETPFSLLDIKEVIWNFSKDKSLIPDGFTT